jgi:arginyl-tRNA synthetase
MKRIFEEKIKESVNEWFSDNKGGFPAGFYHPDFVVEPPKNEQFGEYTTNAALKHWASLANVSFESASTDRFNLVKSSGGLDNLISFAHALAKSLEEKLEQVERVEVAGPGHLNFYVHNKVFTDALERVTMVIRK